jgi:DNA (cytosine-5)-methyltransferase 1
LKKNSHLKPSIVAVDLFCGAGGLTKGLDRAGIKTALGVDIDPDCEYPYTANNDARFLKKSVAKLTPAAVKKEFAEGEFSLLAGCAPCQPFSTYSQGRERDEKWGLINQFRRLVVSTSPDFVTMENVPGLAATDIFKGFVGALEKRGYSVSHQTVNCADYGVPQTRKRLVLLASKHGPIELIKPTIKQGNYKRVKEVIGGLEPLEAGEISKSDKLHHASSLSPKNLKRIKASKPGGTWRDWPRNLIAECHRKYSGKTYPGVYGRMVWDEPSPTITTQYFGFGNGRFGHPEQNRAISLREGAILQSFPKSYKFVAPGDQVHFKRVGRLIGNAVPVKLGEAIGRSIIKHAKSIRKQRRAS